MSGNIDLKNIKKQAGRLMRLESQHFAFIGIMAVLLVYMFMVWQISKLAVAEPSDSQNSAIQTQVPKIDQQAVNQIESLEQGNTQVHSLFDNARNNPFQE